MQVVTTTVTETIIDDHVARALLKREDCDDKEIEQLRDYVRHKPELIREPEFANWLKHHKEDIMRLAQEVWTTTRARDSAQEEADRTLKKRMTGED